MKRGGEKKQSKTKQQKKEALVLRCRSLPAENVLVLQQYELHYLVLVDHVDRHVPHLRLWPQQRGPKHDGHALGVHAVLLAVVDHPGGEARDRTVSSSKKVMSETEVLSKDKKGFFCF